MISVKKYSIDNDYLWNTAFSIDFRKLKSTMCGIGALSKHYNELQVSDKILIKKDTAIYLLKVTLEH